MGTITMRKRKDNSVSYTAQIRINRDGRTVYLNSPGVAHLITITTAQ